MENKKTKLPAGFTIIELLVVVAIIAVLAAIVLVNVTSYINKGKNASIKGNLSTVLTNSAVYYDTNSNYNTFCTNAYFTAPQSAIQNAGGAASCACNTVGCAATATAFCACSTELGSANTFCVDSTGAKKETATACATECAQSTGAVCQ